MSIFGFFAAYGIYILGFALFTIVLVGLGVAYTVLMNRRKNKDRVTREQLEAFQQQNVTSRTGMPSNGIR